MAPTPHYDRLPWDEEVRRQAAIRQAEELERIREAMNAAAAAERQRRAERREWDRLVAAEAARVQAEAEAQRRREAEQAAREAAAAAENHGGRPGPLRSKRY